MCPADAGGRPVYGTGTYTTDSDICSAALHAGAVLPGKGGKVRLLTSPGCQLYRGSASHGINSARWGAYGASFFFAGHGDGRCYQRPKGACPDTFRDAIAEGSLTPAGELSCTCDSAMVNGPLWGTDIYTHDSSICLAAAHAGAIDKHQGGEVRVQRAPGCPVYVGSDRRGIQANRWRAHQVSFFFPGYGDGLCYAPPEGGCPPTYDNLPSMVRSGDYSCRCDANLATGGLWGTDIYTTDSSICRAGVHAGAVPMETGGLVTVRPAHGCDRYIGSQRNGVASAPWGPFKRSFSFVGHGNGLCVEPNGNPVAQPPDSPGR